MANEKREEPWVVGAERRRAARQAVV